MQFLDYDCQTNNGYTLTIRQSQPTDKQLATAHGTTNTINRQQSANAHSITNTINRQTIDHWKKKTTRLLKEETYVFSFKRAQPTARKL